MKKLLLLITASSIGLSLSAQQNASIMGSSSMLMPRDLSGNIVRNHEELFSKLPGRTPNVHVGNKSTTLRSRSHSEWFDYWDATKTTSSTLYYFSTAQDSNIYDMAGSSGGYNIYCHGLGESFDPTDLNYYQAFGAPGNGLMETVPMPDNIGFTIDSFRVPYEYIRNNNSTAAADSLIIEIAGSVNTSATDSGTFRLSYLSSAANAVKTDDSTPRAATAIYTRQASAFGASTMWDSIKTQKQRYAFPLVLADTGNILEANFALTPAMNIPAKGKVVSFVHFKSAFTTTLGSASGGSTSSNSNYLHLYMGNPAGGSTAWLKQTKHADPSQNSGYAGSFQTSLIAENDIRYADTGYLFRGHNILIPGVAFNGPDYSGPTQAFHVMWTNMEEDAVANVNTNINSLKAFPNPANDKLIVSFDLKNDANVTVTLTNTVGQVVASQVIGNAGYGSVSFNTTDLPSGVYFYTVVANGQRSTGNVAVAH